MESDREGICGNTRRCRNADEHSARRYLIESEPLAGKPMSQYVHVMGCWTVSVTDLLWSEPTMVSRRHPILLISEQLIEL
jgi:hypothetical protein